MATTTPDTDGTQCFLDHSRPCGCCAAPSPLLCPYPYLLAGDEELVEALRNRTSPSCTTDAASLPSAVNSRPVASPRPPLADGETWS